MTKEFVFDKKEFDKWEIQKDENNNPVLVDYKDKENQTLYIPNEADLAPFGYKGPIRIKQHDLHILVNEYEKVIVSNKNNKKVVRICDSTDSSENALGTYRFYDHSCKVKELDLRGLDTSNFTDLSYFFYQLSDLEKLNIEGWDTSNVKSMEAMFMSDQSLKEIKGLENLNTSKVENMAEMFCDCYSLENIDLSNWDFSHVLDTKKMFQFNISGAIVTLPEAGAPNLRNSSSMFTVSDVRIENIDKFKMPKLEDATYTFADCPYDWEVYQDSQDDYPMQQFINNIGSSLKVADYMFAHANNTQDLDISKLPAKNLQSAKGMFEDSNIKITGLDQLEINDKCNTYRMFKNAKDEVINTKKVKRAKARFAKTKK